MGVTGQLPSVGRIVHYRLSQADADAIAFERTKLMGAPRNPATTGDVYPAVVVRVNGGLSVNLQVKLDGPDTHWATSRNYSAETQGCWFWPPRVDG